MIRAFLWAMLGGALCAFGLLQAHHNPWVVVVFNFVFAGVCGVFAVDHILEEHEKRIRRALADQALSELKAFRFGGGGK